MNDNFDFEIEFNRLLELVNGEFNSFFQENKKSKLYDAFKYTIEGGGKRIRPILTMITAAAFGEKKPEAAIHPALAIEVIHNFTLLHDDIMDNSPIRHGRATVYKKWNTDVAILSGDSMIGYAYKFLVKEFYRDIDVAKELIKTLSDAIIEVCEGQELDTNFNTAKSVLMEEYFRMVELKTSALLRCAGKLGVIVADVYGKNEKAIDNFAIALGTAFQIQDDMFDFNSNNTKFGKKMGQDIFENKKTFPIIKAKELATDKKDVDFIKKYYANKINPTDADVSRFIEIFNKLNIPQIAEDTIIFYIKKAKKSISILPKNNYSKMLNWFLYYILKREY